MTADFARYQKGYENLWRMCALTEKTKQRVIDAAYALTRPDKMQHYDAAAAASGVPAGLIAALNYRESGGSFSAYLGNGDPLDKVTTHVPEGRGPFKTWAEGAADALRDTPRPPGGTWTIAFALFFAESFNGRGYEAHNENSPYVWSQTSLEQSGMFTGDHRYDPTAWDGRPGVAALFVAFQSTCPRLVLPTVATPTEAPVPTTPAAPANDPLPAIIHGLDSAKNLLPMVAAFIPPPIGEIVMIGVPIIEDVLTLIEQSKTTGVQQDDIANLLHTIADRLHSKANTLKANTPA